MPLPSCIIAVDVQVGFLNDVTASIPGDLRRFLVEHPIEHRIFTRFINPGPGGQFEKVLGWSGLSDKEDTMLAREVWGLPTLVVDKQSYGPFVGTELEAILHRIGARDVLVCGIDTDICVLATAVDLFDRGFRPFVISDLSMSHAGPELHDAALRILPRFIGGDGIVTVAELTALELTAP